MRKLISAIGILMAFLVGLSFINPKNISPETVGLEAIAVKDKDLLYAKCFNPIKIIAPEKFKGEEHKFSFIVKGGIVKKGKDIQEIIVYPTFTRYRDSLSVSIKFEGQFLTEKVFKVRNAPMPDIVLRNEKRKPISLGKGTKPLEKLILDIVPQKEFQQGFPKECRYTIDSVSVALVEGSKYVKPPLKFSAETILDISQLKKLAKPGHRLIIETKGILRRDARGVIEKRKSHNVYTLPII